MDKYQYNKIISEKICDNLPILFSALNIEMEDCGKYYRSRCFIHDGDNEGALNLYPFGYTIRGYWHCNSHHCEETFGKTILGFIWGVLSSQKLNWRCPNDQKLKWDEVSKFLDNLYGKQNIRIEESKDYDVSGLFHAPKLINTKITRQLIRKKLQIPAEFYLKRGYSFDILDKYDIGLCDTQYKEMSNRIVVPIYDDDYKYMVKCVGRSKYNECAKCGFCHANLDCDKVKYKFVKWKNQENVRDYLFNYWFAKKHIQQTKCVCLVESPGNVLRLEEAGIHNSLGIFGTSITDIQRIKLEMSGAMSCLIIMDNDPNNAGQVASDKILQKLGRIMNIETYQTKTNDIGDMLIPAIKEEILPLINKMEKQYV